MSAAPGHYRAPARWLHWLVAALLPLQFALGYLSETLHQAALARWLLLTHFQLGVLLMALLAARIGWRLAAGVPPAPSGTPRWQHHCARVVHLALYGLLLALVASGYVIWVWMEAPRTLLGLVELPAVFTPPPHDERGRALAWYVHVWGAWLLLGLVALHLAAARWHQQRRGDGSLGGRMLRRRP